MNFFELILAMLGIIGLLFSLLVLFFRNNATILRAMLVPSIFLEDVGDTNTFRMPRPTNKALGINESMKYRRDIRLKKQFSIQFGLLLFWASLVLLYFAVY